MFIAFTFLLDSLSDFIVELRHGALDKCYGFLVVLEDSLLSLVVCRAHRLAPSLPPGHEMIRCQGLAKQFFGIAFEFSENLRGELMVLLAERRDPGREGERSPVDQMIREAY